MVMSNVYIFFVTVFFGMECRSIGSSNRNQAVEGLENHETLDQNFLPDMNGTTHDNDVTNMEILNRELVDRISKHFLEELAHSITNQSLTLKKLTAFSMNAVNVTNQEHITVPWLKLLKLILDDLERSIPIIESTINEVNHVGKKESKLHEENENFMLIGRNNWLEDLQEILDDQYIDAVSSKDSQSDKETTSMDSSILYSLIDHGSEETEDGLLEEYDSQESDGMDTELQNDISGTQKRFGKLCRKHHTAE